MAALRSRLVTDRALSVARPGRPGTVGGMAHKRRVLVVALASVASLGYVAATELDGHGTAAKPATPPAPVTHPGRPGPRPPLVGSHSGGVAAPAHRARNSGHHRATHRRVDHDHEPDPWDPTPEP